MVYSSKQNPLVKKIAALKDKKYRKEYSAYIAEGLKPALEAVKLGASVRYMIVREDKAYSVPQGNYEILIVSDGVFSFLSEEKTPQGVMAVIDIPESKVLKPRERNVLLDGVQDPGNVGAIIRSAAAFGYENAYLINCADPYSQKAVRASMSGIFSVSVMTGGADEILSALSGTNIVAGDMNGVSLKSVKISGDICVAVGSEGTGLSEKVKAAAETVVSIPMSDKTESLNAAVAASILMYELKK